MKSERARLTDRLDELCLQIIRLRDDNRCQKCNKFITGSDSHPSHVVPKGRGANWRRFDLINIKLLCTHHHLNWWHTHIVEAALWFLNRFPARNEYLEKYRYGQSAKISTPEMRDLVVQYKQKLKDLKGT